MTTKPHKYHRYRRLETQFRQLLQFRKGKTINDLHMLPLYAAFATTEYTLVCAKASRRKLW